MPSTLDGNKMVLSGYCPGDQFPKEKRQLNYSLEADGYSKNGPFMIEGALYGKNIHFTGPGVVAGPILGRGDIKLDNKSIGAQRFLSGLCANGNIISAQQGASIKISLNGDLGFANYVIRGEVVGENIMLENTIVFGSLHAKRIQLINCLVFGGAIATDTLRVVCSTLLNYQSSEILFEGPCAVLHAMGESRSQPDIAPYEDGAGDTWEGDIRYYPVYRGHDDGAITNRSWLPRSAAYRQAKLYVDYDWVEREIQERDGRIGVRYILSIGGRAVDFSKLKTNVEHLKDMICSGLEFDHYDANTQSKCRREWHTMCIPEELKVMHMVTDPIERSAGNPEK
jgi:hypothetical protein